jgi:hypothetical protein
MENPRESERLTFSHVKIIGLLTLLGLMPLAVMIWSAAQQPQPGPTPRIFRSTTAGNGKKKMPTVQIQRGRSGQATLQSTECLPDDGTFRWTIRDPLNQVVGFELVPEGWDSTRTGGITAPPGAVLIAGEYHAYLRTDETCEGGYIHRTYAFELIEKQNWACTESGCEDTGPEGNLAASFDECMAECYSSAICVDAGNGAVGAIYTGTFDPTETGINPSLYLKRTNPDLSIFKAGGFGLWHIGPTNGAASDAPYRMNTVSLSPIGNYALNDDYIGDRDGDTAQPDVTSDECDDAPLVLKYKCIDGNCEGVHVGEGAPGFETEAACIASGCETLLTLCAGIAWMATA